MDLIKKISKNVRSATYSATQIISDSLSAIDKYNPLIGSVTVALKDRALATAQHIDQLVAQGQDPGPLAGVPFGVKDLFDVKDITTTAGSVLLADHAPALKDATVITRLCNAGAVPVATLNMDEFAYGFVTDNTHYGITKNPHDTRRFAGGSSGGSAAAVAAGMMAFSLGSDTNGSIRVPASLCGVWGLRPAYNTIPLQGVYPFSETLDTIGPFCSSIHDLKCIFNILSDRNDHGKQDISSLKIARLKGWFERDVDQEILNAITEITSIGIETYNLTLDHIETVRAASFLITASEGGTLHLPYLRKEPLKYDPATRDRFIAGALLPVSTYLQAKKIEKWFRHYIHKIFGDYDLLIAPATGCTAPFINDPTVLVDGKKSSARVNLGIYTQPLSLSGCPILSLPLNRTGKLPVGLQIVAKPGNEHILFEFGALLEAKGIAKASIQQQGIYNV
ncbi:Asp-tRNAAsn/Glu-tRNAGln amidotransferase A subunit or related amidase (GatA) (PDB:3H0L) [Commensalibacter communis]|uniref:AtzE family amidohydrolase n=1 Tax=Commensalibacter communis TaxID=2972786 RepID=UPI0022FF8539|nr:AtzE family amidohydrolase [Commensalibacter communis]CAI3958547.1 Asp-tRNAAsn/Glu-tRNAGln amidotransferase A subunit or related amidase (GatA) (PDB:3H0L) [Commensalibacter communis]